MQRGIHVTNLTKVYETRRRTGWFSSRRDAKVAVAGLNMSVLPGRVTGLLGLNGAGKTTTIKILSTLLLPTSGQVEIDGRDLVREAAQVRPRINMISGSERLLYWRLTGRENLWYFAQLYGIAPREVQPRIQSLLELTGLADAADKPVEQYSKGMKQRLQIARGLINDPDYLFLDEPTLGLDVPVAREMRKTIKRLAEADGKGVLLTSHYLTEVEELCSYIYVLNQGRLIAEGTSADLKAMTHRKRAVRVILPALSREVETALNRVALEGDAEILRSEGPEGMTVILRSSRDLIGQVAAAITMAGGAISKLEGVEPTLEDALLTLAQSPSAQRDESHAVR